MPAVIDVPGVPACMFCVLDFSTMHRMIHRFSLGGVPVVVHGVLSSSRALICVLNRVLMLW